MTQEPEVPEPGAPVKDGMGWSREGGYEPLEPVGSERSRLRDLPLRALEMFLGLPRRVQYGLIALLAAAVGRLAGVDAALVRMVVGSAVAEAPVAPGRCSGARPAEDLDAERADEEALDGR